MGCDPFWILGGILFTVSATIFGDHRHSVALLLRACQKERPVLSPNCLLEPWGTYKCMLLAMCPHYIIWTPPCLP
jgi:hypothetical protein